MADNTPLNPGAGGDTIATEDTGAGYKIPVSKIRLGTKDVDGGDVSAANPFPVAVVDPVSGQAASVIPVNGVNEQAVYDQRGASARDDIRAAVQAIVDALAGVLQTSVSGTVPVSAAGPLPTASSQGPVAPDGSQTVAISATTQLSPFISPVSGAPTLAHVISTNGVLEQAVTDARAENRLDEVASTLADVRDAMQNPPNVIVGNFPPFPATQQVAGSLALAGPAQANDFALNEQGVPQQLQGVLRNGAYHLLVYSPDAVSKLDAILDVLSDMREALNRLAPP